MSYITTHEVKRYFSCIYGEPIGTIAVFIHLMQADPMNLHVILQTHIDCMNSLYYLRTADTDMADHDCF